MNDQAKDSLVDQVRGWVEVTGRALELRTAREFYDGGAHSVDQSYDFVDPTDGVTQREGDVLATFTWTTRSGSDPQGLVCNLRVVVECKSSRAKPWVAFEPTDSEQRADKLTDWLVRSWAPWTPIGDIIESEWAGCAPFDDAPTASHIIAAHLGKGAAQDEDGSKNIANDAVRQVLAAANAVAQRDTVASNSGPPRGVYVIAAIVTAAPLFTCALDESGEVTVTGVDHVAVHSRRDNQAQRVHVMNEEKLPAFIEAVRNLAIRADRP